AELLRIPGTDFSGSSRGSWGNCARNISFWRMYLGCLNAGGARSTTWSTRRPHPATTWLGQLGLLMRLGMVYHSAGDASSFWGTAWAVRPLHIPSHGPSPE